MKTAIICFAASSGGHFEQIMMLKPLMDKYAGFVVTEKTKYEVNCKNEIYYVKQINRKEKGFVLYMIMNFFGSFRIFIKKKPDIIISTGALSTIPLCIIAKLFKKKLIFIESFAKINSPTRTGDFLYRYTDRFYVQWESMLKFYPNAIYKGNIY